jgi:outer membrane protein assembly factor BamE (lipoprotein component of BamABCDE complex)
MNTTMNAIKCLGLGVLLAGCATFPEKQEKANSPLTAGNVTLTLKKGVTTKVEVLKAFGSPNLVTKNREADEVWNYNRMSFTTRVGEDAGGLIFWGGSRAVSTATTKSFDLIITFDTNDVVKDYSIIQASF